MLDRNITAFLRRLDGSPPPAVILGPAGAIALGFARSLGRRGIPVVISGLGERRMLSRYCVEAPSVSGEESLGEFIRELGERLTRKGVMVPAGDAEALFMARNRSGIEKHFSFVLPDSAVVEMLVNKKAQYRFAEDLGIPLPRTYYPEGPEDIPEISRHVDYPCIVKPVYAHFRQSRNSIIGIRPWEKLLVANSAEELSAAAARMTQAGLEFVIHRKIVGK
jgi:predicted ATP-grasp superfamily ATP-dependent carboligase